METLATTADTTPAQDAMVRLARFGAWAIRELRDDNLGADLDGGAAQDEALRLGVLVTMRKVEPCGEECACLEYGDFPTECYRFPADIAQVLRALMLTEGSTARTAHQKETPMRTATIADINAIAAVCHEANRAYCATLGDLSQPTWFDAPVWQRESALTGVRKIASGEVTRPEQSHESWSAQKIAEGWRYGELKDPDAKTHHCLVPFDQLPPEQQAKDRLFLAIATALL